jgi:phage terminase large subunit
VRVQTESYKAYRSGKKLIVNQGGSRSGKTYGIIKLLIGLALKERLHISICSVAFPHLRRGAMRDWQEIMDNYNLYDPGAHYKTDQSYTFPNGSMMEFFSVDDSMKVRGPGRDILFLNEANLINNDTFRQLKIRTRKVCFLDYNPADEFHWIYDEVLHDPDCAFIKTTYLDNPFLTLKQKHDIEAFKEIDPNFWRVYGLGERGTSEATIYPRFNLFNSNLNLDYCFGLDFGFNHPNALIKVAQEENNLYWEEMLYQSHMTTPDLIQAIKPIVGQKFVYCDSARPEVIEELRRAGINAYGANKNVKEGIDFVRSHNLFIHQNSVNTQKEVRSYKWKTTPDGRILDEPVKAFDDATDAGRYGSISFKNSYTAPILTFHR